MTPSSSGNSRVVTSLRNRLETIFRKAYELSILCETEVCVIYYGPYGELKTWPEEREEVIDMALRYREATKRKKSLTLHEFVQKEKEKEKKLKKKKKKNANGFKYPDWYPVFEHYSPHQLSQLIQSLELTLSKLQQRLRFLEAQKQMNTNLLHRTYQNPSQFSLSQPLLSASHSNQLTNYQYLDFSGEPRLKNHLMMQQELSGFEHNMFITDIPNRNVLDLPHLSNTQVYSALSLVQASEVNNYGLKNLQELCGSSGHNMSDISTNSNACEHFCLSNTVPHEFCSNFQKILYGDMVGSTSFSQDFPDMFSSYSESYTIPNNNSRFL